MTTLSLQLLELLTDKPQKADEIVDMLSLSGSSELRKLVHELRKNGYPVCSRKDNGGGYWLGNKAETERTLADLKSRLKELSEVIDGMEKGVDIGQMEVRTWAE